MKIGYKLKHIRESKRMSQNEVANLLNVTQKTLSNIESGKSKPTIEQLSILGNLFEIDIIELLSQEGIHFYQENQQGGENGIINHYHSPEKIIETFELLLKEKDEVIKLLKEQVRILNK